MKQLEVAIKSVKRAAHLSPELNLDESLKQLAEARTAAERALRDLETVHEARERLAIALVSEQARSAALARVVMRLNEANAEMTEMLLDQAGAGGADPSATEGSV